MKQFLATLILATSATLTLQAQDSAGFSAPSQPRDVRELHPGKPEDLQGIKGTGIIVMMSEHGLEVINPFAPASLGIGRKTLTQNIAQEGRIGDENHDRKPFGGIKLIGFDF